MSDVVLIDLSGILHATWHTETANPDPNATSTKTVERVRALASGQPHVGIAVDSRTSVRKAIDASYKANRESNEPLQHQMRLAIETLRGDGFPILGADGYEADDLIASAVTALGPQMDERGCSRIVIVSADKDLLQLVCGEAIVRKSPLDGEVIDEAAMLTAKKKDGALKFGIRPDQVVDYLTLLGDKSDNVAGCPGIGEVWARTLLAEFGSLDAMYAQLDAGATPTLTPARRTALQNFRAQMPTTRELIRLRTDVPVDVAALFAPRTPTTGETSPFSEDMAQSFREYVPAALERYVERYADVPKPLPVAESTTLFDEAFEESPEARRRAAPTVHRAGSSVDARATASEEIDSAPKSAASGALSTQQNGDIVNTQTGEAMPIDHGRQREHQRDHPVAAATATAEEVMPPDRSGQVQRNGNGRGTEEASAPATVAVGTSTTPAATPHFLTGMGVANDAQRQQMARDIEMQQRSMVPIPAPVPAPVEIVTYERQLEPRSLGDAYKLAQSMFQARLFSAYGNADAVLSTILAGREFGMPAMASLRAMHIIEGKPTLAADTIRALVLRSGAAEYFRCTERTNERATFVTKRKGEPEMSLTFTIEEAKQAWSKTADAWAKSGWGKNPADLLVARSGAKLARLVYPDVVHGLYAREEME